MRRLLYTLLCIGMAIGLPVSSFALQAAFTAVPASSCSPVLVNFTDQSTGTPISWKWSFGDGTFNSDTTIANASHTYFVVGTYSVTLTVWDGTTSSSVTHSIVVNPKPIVSFIASDSSVSCAPKTVTFNNTTTLGTAGAGTYSWDFGDGGTSTATSPTYTYNVPGVYNVTLVAVNSGGCTQSLTKNTYITILAKPHADFTSANNSSCTIPATVTFSNTSTGSSSYQWDFGDGGTSTATSPSHTYNATGTYTVRLIASNGSCTDTMTKTAFVNIVNGLVASFTSSTPTCANQLISFTNTTVGSTMVTWDFGDGTASTFNSPTHAYTTAGTYTVTLTTGNGSCSSTVSHTVMVSTKPTASFSATNITGCSVPLTVSFSNASTGATSYTWDFGDGGTSTTTSPSHTYTAFGTYTVRLIATNAAGCSDTFNSVNLVDIAPPSGYISANYISGCAPLTINLGGWIAPPNAIATIAWDFGDGTTGNAPNLYHTYTAVGTYTVTGIITTTTGCSFTPATLTINVNPKPTAGFSAAPTTVCPNQPVTFTNSSTGTVTTYTWIFGNGSTSSATNPTTVYSNPGTYTVTLVANNGGCADTLTQPNLIVVNPPKADFNYTVSCTNRLQVTFTDASTAAQTYWWDFGDGATLTGVASPVHTYSTFGTYTVRQAVTNSVYGCTDTMTKIVKLFPLVSQFTSNDTSICKGGTASFTATSNANYAGYTWDFGDGTAPVTTTANTTSHIYTAVGAYTVTLTVKDIYNCIFSSSRVNYIKVKGPVVAFTNTPTIACAPAAITFTNNTTFPQGTTGSAYTWKFGDGTISNTPNPIHTYTTAGTYTVTLIASDASSCTDSISHVGAVVVNRPTANFTSTPTNACLNVPITFTNASTGGSALTYSWDFGDGTTSAATNPTHAYAANGTYTVRLIATEAGGCSDTMIKPAYINVSNVIANFNLSDTAANCPPLTVNFTNTSTGGVTYHWTFGNGSTSTSPNPSSVFTSPGVYQVKLKVTNAAGCVDSIIKTVTVHGPTGTFSVAPLSGCAPLTVTFTATTTNTQYVIWDFDNGTTLTTSNAVSTYTYAAPGNYVPKLIVSNGNNCDLAVSGTDTVKVGGMVAAISHQPTSLCNSGTIFFTDTIYSTTATVTTRNWTFGDGGTSTAHNPAHTYTSPGTYIVKLVLTNLVGCKDTVTDTVNILPKPTVSTSGNAAFCAGGSTTLNATGATSYTWSPATGLSCTTCASPVANPTTTTTYTVVGTGVNGCTDTNQVIVTVNPLPTISAGSNVSICNGASTTLTATGGTSYTWTPATGLSCTSCASPTANPANTTTYTVTGTNANGCSNTATVTVNVTATPVISGGPNQTICTGSSTTLNASGGVSYTWTPATGLSCTACASPTASPAATTTYTVTGTAAGGCTGTAQVTVTVTNLPTVSAGANTAICTGSSTTLTATGATTYSWTPATGLSCTNCASPVANPTTTTTYTVTGTATGGCSNTAQVIVTVNPLPTISAGSNATICSGGSTTLTATGGTSYTWTPATGLSCTNCASPTANPTTTTTYTVTGTNANGCSNTSTVTVNVNTPPTISAGANQTICTGSSTTLTATGGVSYSWSPATGLSCTSCASPTASPAATTTYTVTGTGANGCTATSQVTVTVTNLPSVSAGSNTAICAGSSTTLTATGATTYSWTPTTGLSCTSCASPVANPANTTTYTVTGTATGGCSNTAQVTVTVNPLPTISAGSNVSICNGGSTTLTATGGTTYSWTPATGLSCTTCASPTAAPTSTTTYTVTGTSNGCSSTSTVTVTVNTAPTISAGTGQSICKGNSTTLTATGGVSYSWTPATGLSCTTCASPTASPTSTTTYTVTGTGANGCTATSQVTVTIYAQPVISGGANQNLCNGSSVTLSATGGATYTWTPATGLSCTSCPNPTANPSATTTYTVTGTDAHGCVDSGHVTVTVNPLPIVSAGANRTICAGTTTQLQATGGTTYNWSPATGLSCTSCANPIANPTTTTTYTVTGTSAAGCSATSTVTVTVNPAPGVTAGAPQTICKGNAAQLNAIGAQTYSWSPAAGLSCTTCPNPIATPTAPTTYTVTGTDANGCTASATVAVNFFAPPTISAGADQTICVGSSAQLQATGGISYVWSPASDLSCSNCPNPVATPTANTAYQVVGTDVNGCKDSAKLNVIVIQHVPTAVGPGDTLCKGESANLSASGGTSYQWSPSAGLNSITSPTPIATPDVTTTYMVLIKENQCFTDTDYVTVVVHPQPTVDLGPDQAVGAGAGVTLNPKITDATIYQWTPTTFLSCSDCPNPVASPIQTTTYQLVVSNEFGCRDSDMITLSVECDNSQLFIPNTFTPNGDGQNDIFYPHGKGVSTIKRMRVYDRWGELVFDATNMPVNDPSAGWDGSYKGQRLTPDTYIYIVDATCVTGQPLQIKGDVSLIR